MLHPVDLSNEGSTSKVIEKNHKKEKVIEAVTTRCDASNDIQYVQLPAARRLDFLEMSLSPFNVISMNVSGPGDGPGTALRTRKLIADVIMSNEPDIVLFQEFKWQGIRGHAWNDTPLPDYYAYTGNKEASIMYDTRRFQLTELPQAQLQAPLDELLRKGEVSQDFTPLARSCIRLLETHGPDTFKVLVASWHGPYKNGNEEEKKEQFQNLQVYLKELSVRANVPILLGGDFNMKMSLIRRFLLPDFIPYEYIPSKRREGRTIDYFIASPVLTLTNVRYIDITNTEVQNPYELCDHDPISTTVECYRPHFFDSSLSLASPVLTLTDVGYIDITKLSETDDKRKNTKSQVPYRLLDHDQISTTVARSRTPGNLIHVDDYCRHDDDDDCSHTDDDDCNHDDAATDDDCIHTDDDDCSHTDDDDCSHTDDDHCNHDDAAADDDCRHTDDDDCSHTDDDDCSHTDDDDCSHTDDDD